MAQFSSGVSGQLREAVRADGTGEPVRTAALSGDSFRESCDHVFWSNAAPRENPAFRSGDVIFCKIDEVWRLFRALRRTRRRIVLVTGEGSKPVGTSLWKRRPPHVAAWFGTNMFVSHRTAHAIPLGLGNAGAATTPSFAEIIRARRTAGERGDLLYANFGDSTNPKVRAPLSAWLRDAERRWVTRSDHQGQAGKKVYLEQLVRHRFVLCPPGTGEDTHRFWEALYAGCIPVIRDSIAMRNFSSVLPVLVVRDLREISELVLRAFVPDGPAAPEDHAPLWMPYWHKRILMEKIAATRRGSLSLSAFLTAWMREAVAVAVGKTRNVCPVPRNNAEAAEPAVGD